MRKKPLTVRESREIHVALIQLADNVFRALWVEGYKHDIPKVDAWKRRQEELRKFLNFTYR